MERAKRQCHRSLGLTQWKLELYQVYPAGATKKMEPVLEKLHKAQRNTLASFFHLTMEAFPSKYSLLQANTARNSTDLKKLHPRYESEAEVKHLLPL